MGLTVKSGGAEPGCTGRLPAPVERNEVDGDDVEGWALQPSGATRPEHRTET